MTKRMKWIVVGMVAVVLIGVSLRPSAVTVEVGEVVRDSLSVTVSEQGQTRPRGRYTITAPVSGQLARTTFQEGRSVEAGAVLTTMVPPPDDPRLQAAARAALSAAETRLLQAEAGLAEAERSREQAEREVERRRPLLELGALNQETFERFERAAEVAADRVEPARGAVNAARADVRAATTALASSTGAGGAGNVEVVAPVAGTVLRVFEENARVVPVGTPLFEIAGEDGLEVLVDLRTEEAVRVATGDLMRISGWGGEVVLEARVRRVDPAAFTEVSALGVEEQRVYVVGDLLESHPKLGAGYRVEASIVVWSADDVLTVPSSAIFQVDGSWNAFVAEGARARLRRVEIGERGLERSQVLDGLSEGERVILFPSDLVEDGVRVSAERP